MAFLTADRGQGKTTLPCWAVWPKTGGRHCPGANMIAVFMETLPFFALIGLGYVTARMGFFPPDATAYLTRFVFYFALSAMIFRFSATLSLSDVFDPAFMLAYLGGTMAVYVIVTIIALLRGTGPAEAAVEAQCGAIGNIGFLGIPMLAMIMGEAAVGYIIAVLTVDLVVFSSLIVIIITAVRTGHVSLRALGVIFLGVLKNPMIASLLAGLAWSLGGVPMPAPMLSFVTILGAAATPGALFAIGASLASKSAERVQVALWLSWAKLIMHPALVAVFALWVFDVPPYAAAVMIAASALPVAGNVYMLAAHYGVAPQRVSAAILLSTSLGVITVSLIIAQVLPMAGLAGQ